jgi:hypothetical protein
MIKTKAPNALNLFGIRRLNFPVEHFESITMPIVYNMENSITKWIEHNLKGRFYITKVLSTVDNHIEQCIQIGFEDAKELSYFTLACPHLKYT